MIRPAEDDPAQHITMPAEVLGGGVGHEVRAVRQWAQQRGRGESAVQHELCAVCVRQLGQGRDIGEAQQGIGEGLAEEDARLALTQRLVHRRVIAEIDEADIIALAHEEILQQRRRGAVEVAARHDPLARHHAGRQQGGVQRRHPRGAGVGDGPLAPLDGR